VKDNETKFCTTLELARFKQSHLNTSCGGPDSSSFLHLSSDKTYLDKKFYKRKENLLKLLTFTKFVSLNDAKNDVKKKRSEKKNGRTENSLVRLSLFWTVTAGRDVATPPVFRRNNYDEIMSQSTFEVQLGGTSASAKQLSFLLDHDVGNIKAKQNNYEERKLENSYSLTSPFLLLLTSSFILKNVLFKTMPTSSLHFGRKKKSSTWVF